MHCTACSNKKRAGPEPIAAPDEGPSLTAGSVDGNEGLLMSVGLTGSINGAMSLEVPPAEEGSIGAAEGGGEGVSLAAGTFAEPLLEPFQIGAMVRCLWTRKPGVNEKYSTGHECAKVMGPVIEAGIGKMVKALV